MASDNVKKVLEAEAESDKKTAEARRKGEEIISGAERDSSLAIQKKLSEANAAADKIRKSNAAKLADYKAQAEEECSRQLAELRSKAEQNTRSAAEAVIERFFS